MKAAPSKLLDSLKTLVKNHRQNWDSQEEATLRLLSTGDGTFVKKLFREQVLKVDANNPADQDIIEAFAYLDLDHDNPTHWRVMFEALIATCFPKAGAPTTRDTAKALELANDMRLVTDSKPNRRSARQIAIELRIAKTTKAKYEDLEIDTLRKLVGKVLTSGLRGTTADLELLLKREVAQAVRVTGTPHSSSVLLQLATDHHSILWRKLLIEELEKTPALLTNRQLLESMVDKAIEAFLSKQANRKQ